MCKAWLDAMTEYWFFWKKYRKFRIVIFPEMGPLLGGMSGEQARRTLHDKKLLTQTLHLQFGYL